MLLNIYRLNNWILSDEMVYNVVFRIYGLYCISANTLKITVRHRYTD